MPTSAWLVLPTLGPSPFSALSLTLPSRPSSKQGYVEKTQYTVRVPAVTAAWSLPDGSNGSSAALLSAGVPIASLAQGKKIVAGGLNVRITTQTHKPASAWITLLVIDDNQ